MEQDVKENELEVVKTEVEAVNVSTSDESEGSASDAVMTSPESEVAAAEAEVAEEEKQEPKKVICVDIYTDGACSGNPGPGGWAAVLLSKEQNAAKEISGYEAHTTNNKMEILAAINGIKAITSENVKIQIFTDSMYLKNGITSWIKSWKANGWMTSGKEPVKNLDLWQELDALNAKFEIVWNWVKAHSDNKFNNRADELARSEVKNAKSA